MNRYEYDKKTFQFNTFVSEWFQSDTTTFDSNQPNGKNRFL